MTVTAYVICLFVMSNSNRHLFYFIMMCVLCNEYIISIQVTGSIAEIISYCKIRFTSKSFQYIFFGGWG